MSYKDPSLNKLLIPFLDGIPLSITNKLLPLKKKFSPTVFTNLVLPNCILSTNFRRLNNRKNNFKTTSQHHRATIEFCSKNEDY